MFTIEKCLNDAKEIYDYIKKLERERDQAVASLKQLQESQQKFNNESYLYYYDRNGRERVDIHIPKTPLYVDMGGKDYFVIQYEESVMVNTKDKTYYPFITVCGSRQLVVSPTNSKYINIKLNRE